MKNPLVMNSWSPYVVGAGIGMLSWFAFASADHPLGVTTAFENSAAMTARAAVPTIGGKLTLPQLTGTSPWLWVAGLVAGGVLALIISRFKSHRLKGAISTAHTLPGDGRTVAQKF